MKVFVAYVSKFLRRLGNCHREPLLTSLGPKQAYPGEVLNTK